MQEAEVKKSLTSLDVLLLRKEMKVLEGAYIDKAFGSDDLFVRFNTQSGKKEVAVKEGLFLFLSDPLEHEGEVGRFAQFIRKSMDNARVSRIENKGFDRIIKMYFQWPENYLIYFEMMSRGNVIVTCDGKIVQAFRHEKRGSVEILPGSAYTPPLLKFDMLSCTQEEFREAILTSKADIVRTLASRIGLGGDMAEEVCLLTGIDFSTKATELSPSFISQLYETALSIINRTINNPEPTIYFEGDSAFQFTPIPFTKFSTYEHKRLRTLSECISEFLQKRKQSVNVRSFEKQEEAIRKLKQEAMAIRTFAELLSTDTLLLNELHSSMKEGKEGSIKFSRNRDGTYTIMLPDASFHVNFSENRYSFLSSVFDAAKEAERKVESAERALASLRERQVVREERPVVLKRQEKKFWFESYRWFLSSEECLVLGGRDAKSNERLVQKHMEQKDRYVHADIYGAPSVVVKWKEGATEKTLEEACAFAVCFSRAWNAQIGAAAAYWVLPDQVSKTPESGEYLKTGAFVIRGKRNYFSKLPLRLAIGFIEYEGERKLMCAPESAVAARNMEYILLTPGDKSKEKVASELSPLLGVEVDRIVSLLPPGKSEWKQLKSSSS